MAEPDFMSQWRFTAGVPADRQAALSASVSFDELVTIAKAEICKIGVRVDPGRDPGLTDCLQPVFSFELPSVGDRLFNGCNGYRAQYWRDAFDGLKANASLIAALTPGLLAVTGEAVDPNLSKIDVCISLRAMSAKFWIQEIPSLLANPTVDLDVVRWHREAERGVQLARWGLSAPEVTKFNVKGALLDPHGNEVVPSRKIGRHHDIHHYGFS